MIAWCPTCGRLHDAHSGAPGTVPRDGDVSVCWGCGAFGVFVDVDGSLALRVPTDAELADIETDPEAVAAQKAVRVAVTPAQAVAAVWGSS